MSKSMWLRGADSLTEVLQTQKIILHNGAINMSEIVHVNLISQIKRLNRYYCYSNHIYIYIKFGDRTKNPPYKGSTLRREMKRRTSEANAAKGEVCVKDIANRVQYLKMLPNTVLECCKDEI